MKRMLLGTLMSVVIHVFFLGRDFSWLEKKTFLRSNPRIVSLYLTYRPAQQIPRPEPSVKQTESVPAVAPSPGLKKRVMRHTRKTVSPPIALTPVPPREGKQPSRVIPQIETAQIPEQQLTPTPVNREKELDMQTSDVATAVSPAPGQAVSPKNKTDEVLPQVLETFRIEPVIKEARPIYRSNPPPRYPRVARRRGLQGTVILNVYIDKSGRVHDIKVFKTSGHSILDRAALATVKNWSFKPGTRGNEKVEMWVKVPIRFQLK